MRRTPKILIVDDEKRLCESLAYLLTAKNYDIQTANCGMDAFAILEKNRFDLVILDVHLPDMLGTDILKDVSSHCPETMVVLITADANLDSALAALQCGAYDYLRKPFEFEEFLKTVENALQQKKLQREKDSINEKLQISEKKYRDLVQNSPDVIYTLDTKGRFTFVSEAVEGMLGFSGHELIGKHFLHIVHDEDLERAERSLNVGNVKERFSSSIELRLKVNGAKLKYKVSDPYLPVELKTMGTYGDGIESRENKRRGTHGVIRDISERKRIQAQLESAERMKSLGSLAGGIAHDFNNLLTGIQGRSTLMSMELEKDHPHWEHLQAIDEHVRSAAYLTQQLLGFARGGKFEVKPTDMNGLLEKSANMFGRTKKEIIIESQLENADIVVDADRRQMEQVFLNLFVNAWQAMPEGGVLRLASAIVELDEKICRSHQVNPGCYAQITITDNGIGMDKKTLPHIFDPFFTTKKKGRGTGLGLASAYGIIKNHGGFIIVTSELGYGTTFSIYLPVSNKCAVTDLTSKMEITKGCETILLVDDEEMVIDVGKALLEKLGYRVISANSGKSSIEVVHRLGEEIDLVILDMVMPGLDGGRTFDRIREICPLLPILLSSGYAIRGQAEKIIERGCNGFIQKPYNIFTLSKKVRQLLDETSRAIPEKKMFENLLN